MNITTLDQIKTQYYGEVGTPERDRLENELEALRIGFKIRAAREQSGLTQEDVAKRISLSSFQK
jgi:ribosome-binding protein aMBF1 (putative translation factor)